MEEILHHLIAIWVPAKTSDILEQLHQDIDTWYHHETLRNDRGDTKNDGFWYTCSPDFLANIKSSGTMRDTQKTMAISATSFRGCNRFSPLLICIYSSSHYLRVFLHPSWLFGISSINTTIPIFLYYKSTGKMLIPVAYDTICTDETMASILAPSTMLDSQVHGMVRSTPSASNQGGNGQWVGSVVWW